MLEQKPKNLQRFFWNRCDGSFTETHTEYFGWNACHGSLGHMDEAPEILLKLGVRDHDFNKVVRFTKMVPALILSGPPGVAVTGAAKPQTVINYWPTLMNKNLVSPEIQLYGEHEKFKTDGTVRGHFDFSKEDQTVQTSEQVDESLDHTLKAFGPGDQYPLSKICIGRSGDKGDSANIILGFWLAAPRVFVI